MTWLFLQISSLWIVRQMSKTNRHMSAVAGGAGSAGRWLKTDGSAPAGGAGRLRPATRSAYPGSHGTGSGQCSATPVGRQRDRRRSPAATLARPRCRRTLHLDDRQARPAMGRPPARVFRSGCLTRSEAARYVAAGAVGVVTGPFDGGRRHAITGALDERMIGPTLAREGAKPKTSGSPPVRLAKSTSTSPSFERRKEALYVRSDRSDVQADLPGSRTRQHDSLPPTSPAVIEAVPYQIHTVRDGIEHRLIKPNHPWTNGQGRADEPDPQGSDRLALSLREPQAARKVSAAVRRRLQPRTSSEDTTSLTPYE